MTIGSPLRRALSRVERAKARRELGIAENRTVLSILGGSQGAHRLNMNILSGVPSLNGESSRLFILHQTGAADREHAQSCYRQAGVACRVFEFESRMDLVYAASDLVVCRAGALTLQELSFFHVPAVLVPLPTSADGHQKVNAELLADSGCALIRDENEIQSGFLRELLLSYTSDQEAFLRRGQRFARFFRHDGCELFAADVLGLAS
jgi:UDP-N-acetylglucosamine--N-acetylmuramyl-(pentapeptide) pyrophosphoryl-undecaprenol N-acetylglucosamine transferase